jgi:hypothetical protein
MPPIGTRKSRARHFAPPIELSFLEGQISTPQRSALITTRVLAQELNITIPQELVRSHQRARTNPDPHTSLKAGQNTLQLA